MQFSILAAIAFAAGSAMATYNGTVSYTTEVVTAYTTYCPEATSVVFGSSTYTVTEATSLTISGTITVVKPVSTSSVVYCNSCASTGTGLPPTYPTSAPVYPNGTATYAPTSVGTTYVPSSTPTSPISSNSGNKVVGMSGAALAGLLGVAAYAL